MACASADVQQDIDEETATYGADLKSGLIVGVAVEHGGGAAAGRSTKRQRCRYRQRCLN